MDLCQYSCLRSDVSDVVFAIVSSTFLAPLMRNWSTFLVLVLLCVCLTGVLRITC